MEEWVSTVIVIEPAAVTESESERWVVANAGLEGSELSAPREGKPRNSKL